MPPWSDALPRGWAERVLYHRNGLNGGFSCAQGILTVLNGTGPVPRPGARPRTAFSSGGPDSPFTCGANDARLITGRPRTPPFTAFVFHNSCAPADQKSARAGGPQPRI
ncbi:hypothetical protein GCM10009533_69710 [Saccharopolyspora spinosporotrichia]|uniref:Uncharacterized protein n=1 Tax=Saccharopolyspora erythraea TaxID=1836 RepID=A0ABN1ED29_SACER